MNRKKYFKEVIEWREFTFYKGDSGFPKAPRLHNERLEKHPIVCDLERRMEAAMMYGSLN